MVGLSTVSLKVRFCIHYNPCFGEYERGCNTEITCRKQKKNTKNSTKLEEVITWDSHIKKRGTLRAILTLHSLGEPVGFTEKMK